MARRYDPDRRQRIIDAAIAVVAERGIAALSHRAVAAAADVPLGSTTYHFATLDDLLVAALRQVNRGWLTGFARWVDGIDTAAPLADEVIRLVEETLAGDRSRVVLEYELYLAALRHEAVRPIAAACLDEMVRLLGGAPAICRPRGPWWRSPTGCSSSICSPAGPSTAPRCAPGWTACRPEPVTGPAGATARAGPVR